MDSKPRYGRLIRSAGSDMPQNANPESSLAGSLCSPGVRRWFGLLLERRSVCQRRGGKKRPPALARGRFSLALLRLAHGIGALVACLVATNAKPLVALAAGLGLAWACGAPQIPPGPAPEYERPQVQPWEAGSNADPFAQIEAEGEWADDEPVGASGGGAPPAAVPPAPSAKPAPGSESTPANAGH
jgi:hypothetical protein